MFYLKEIAIVDYLKSYRKPDCRKIDPRDCLEDVSVQNMSSTRNSLNYDS